MKENLPSQEEKNNKEHLLREAEHVVNSIWKKATDIEDLPLSVDPSYQVWTEDLERRKSDFARVLFDKARESSGEEKLHSAQTLERLMKLLNTSERQELLKELMTTEETIQELVHEAEQQVKSNLH